MKLTQYKLSKNENGGLKYLVTWLDKEDLSLKDTINLREDDSIYTVERKYDTVDFEEIDLENENIIVNFVIFCLY